MSAMEKVAWTEFLISLTAAGLAAAAVPWIGNAALGFFGLLGFVVAGAWFLRGGRDKVLVDERDREIDRRSIFLGVLAAWLTLFIGLFTVVMWNGGEPGTKVSITPLLWLLWVQVAVSFGVKGATAILSYRGQRHAS